MGIFSFIFGGGNIGLIADSIAKHHKTLRNPREVFNIYYKDFSNVLRHPIGHPRSWKCTEAKIMLEDGEIRNYRDLAILALFVDAAPLNNSYPMVYENFAKSITKKLRIHGIDDELIVGNAFSNKG